MSALRWLCNAGMFDNSFSQICPSKHFKILVRIDLNFKHHVLYSSFESVSTRSSVKWMFRERKDPCSNPHQTSYYYIFFSYWIFFYNVIFTFYPIVLYYYKIQIICIDWFTVFYYRYIKYNLCILTGEPRISFDI